MNELHRKDLLELQQQMSKLTLSQQAKCWNILKQRFPDIPATVGTRYILINLRKLTSLQIQCIYDSLQHTTEHQENEWEERRTYLMESFVENEPKDEICREIEYDDTLIQVVKNRKRRNYLREYGTDNPDKVREQIALQQKHYLKTWYGNILKCMRHCSKNFRKDIKALAISEERIEQEDEFETNSNHEAEFEQELAECVSEELSVDSESEQHMDSISITESDTDSTHSKDVYDKIIQYKQILLRQGVECHFDHLVREDYI